MSGKAKLLAAAAAAAALALMTLPAEAAGDAVAGKKTFQKCALCHAAEQGKNKIGPSLFGIVGRHSASLSNYQYSDAMKKLDKVWDEAMLDTYLADPRKVVVGTKMIFAGIPEEKDRQDLIAYLATLK